MPAFLVHELVFSRQNIMQILVCHETCNGWKKYQLPDHYLVYSKLLFESFPKCLGNFPLIAPFEMLSRTILLGSDITCMSVTDPFACTVFRKHILLKAYI